MLSALPIQSLLLAPQFRKRTKFFKVPHDGLCVRTRSAERLVEVAKAIELWEAVLPFGSNDKGNHIANLERWSLD